MKKIIIGVENKEILAKQRTNHPFWVYTEQYEWCKIRDN